MGRARQIEQSKLARRTRTAAAREKTESPGREMERYFDAFLYLANWGTRHLMIRLPRGLLGLTVAEQYCPGDAASVWAAGDNVILSARHLDRRISIR